MKGKGIRTTIVAMVGLVVLLAVVGMFLFNRINTEQLTVALASVGSILGVIIGFFAKDQNKSHSFNPQGITPPDDDPPPGKDPEGDQ